MTRHVRARPQLLPLSVGLLLACLGSPAAAGYQEGLAAAWAGDYETALREWRPLAELGDPDAQYSLGWLYAYGEGVPQSYETALDWYLKAAAQGNIYAQNNIGKLYQNGNGVPQSYEEAVKWFRMAANGGNAVAQYNLGSMYMRGRGVAEDKVQAHFWWSLARSGDLKPEIRSDVEHDLELVESRMSSAELAEAKKLRENWQPAPN